MSGKIPRTSTPASREAGVIDQGSQPNQALDYNRLMEHTPSADTAQQATVRLFQNSRHYRDLLAKSPTLDTHRILGREAQAGHRELIIAREAGQLEAARGSLCRLFQNIDYLPIAVVRDRLDGLIESTRPEDKLQLLPIAAAELASLSAADHQALESQIAAIVEIARTQLHDYVTEQQSPEKLLLASVLLSNTEGLSQQQVDSIYESFEEKKNLVIVKLISSSCLDLSKLSYSRSKAIIDMCLNLAVTMRYLSRPDRSLSSVSNGLATLASLPDPIERKAFLREIISQRDQVLKLEDCLKLAIIHIVSKGSKDALKNIMLKLQDDKEEVNFNNLLNVSTDRSDPMVRELSHALSLVVANRGMPQVLAEALVRLKVDQTLAEQLFSARGDAGQTALGLAMTRGETRGMRDLGEAMRLMTFQAEDQAEGQTESSFESGRMARILMARDADGQAALVNTFTTDNANRSAAIATFGELVLLADLPPEQTARVMSSQPDDADAESGLSHAIATNDAPTIEAYGHALAGLGLSHEALEVLLTPQTPATIAEIVRDPVRLAQHPGVAAFRRVIDFLQFPPPIERRLIGFLPEEPVPERSTPIASPGASAPSKDPDRLSALSEEVINDIIRRVATDTPLRLANAHLKSLGQTSWHLMQSVRDHADTFPLQATQLGADLTLERFMKARERGQFSEVSRISPTMTSQLGFLIDDDVRDRINSILVQPFSEEKRQLLFNLTFVLPQMPFLKEDKFADVVQNIVDTSFAHANVDMIFVANLLRDTSLLDNAQANRLAEAIINPQQNLTLNFPTYYGIDMSKIQPTFQAALMNIYIRAPSLLNMNFHTMENYKAAALSSLSSIDDPALRVRLHQELVAAIPPEPSLNDVFPLAVSKTALSSAERLRKLFDHLTSIQPQLNILDALHDGTMLGRLLPTVIKARTRDIAKAFADICNRFDLDEAAAQNVFTGNSQGRQILPITPLTAAINTGNIDHINDVKDALLGLRFKIGETTQPLSKAALENILGQSSSSGRENSPPMTPLAYLMSPSLPGFNALPAMAAYGSMIREFRLDDEAIVRLLSMHGPTGRPPLHGSLRQDQAERMRMFGRTLATLALPASVTEAVLTFTNPDLDNPIGPHTLDDRQLATTPNSVAAFVGTVQSLRLPEAILQRLLNFTKNEETGQWQSPGVAGSNAAPNQLVWRAPIVDNPADSPGAAAFKTVLRSLYRSLARREAEGGDLHRPPPRPA